MTDHGTDIVQKRIDEIEAQESPLVKRTFFTRVREFLSIEKDSRLAGGNIRVRRTTDLTVPGDRADWSEKRDAVIQIIAMYRGIAEWGNQLTRKIINYRIGFVFPQGVKAEIVVRPEPAKAATEALQSEDRAGVPIPALETVEAVIGQPELDFIQDSVIDFNNLDGKGTDDFAKCREFEGQVLVHLRTVTEEDSEGNETINIALDVIPWIQTDYEVFFNTVNEVEVISAGIDRVVIEEANTDIEGRSRNVGPTSTVSRTLRGDEVAFIAFDTIARSIIGTPSLSGLINDLEDIDKAEADMRQGNKYYAHPVPVFEAETTEEAARLNEIISESTDQSWKIGDPKIIAGKFSLVSLDLDGQKALADELVKKIQIISAGTNVPVQHLGFPELMSNRATAENTMEPIANFVLAEQEIWQVFYNEVFDKAINLRNKAAKGTEQKLNTGMVKSVLKATTEKALRVVKDIKIPLAAVNQWPYDELRQDVPTSWTGEELEAALEEQRAKDAAAREGALGRMTATSAIPAATTASLITAAASDEEDLIEGADEQVLNGGGSA